MNKALTYVLGIVGVIIIFSCQDKDNSPIPSSPKPLKWRDSIINYADTLWNDYYQEELDSSEVMNALEKLEREIKKKPESKGLRLAYLDYCRGKVLLVENDQASAIAYYQKTLDRLTKLSPQNYYELEGKLNQNISLCYYYSEDYYTALEYSLKAAEYSDHLPADLKSDIYNLLSRLYRAIGDIDNAKTYLDNAIATYEIKKDQAKKKEKRRWERKWGSACNDMVFLLAERFQDPKAAIPYIEKSLSVFSQAARTNSDSGDLANCYHNMGVTYNSMGMPVEALQYYEQSLSLNQSLSRRGRFIARNLNNIGIIYKKEGRLIEAKQTSFQSLDYFNKVTDKLSMAYLYDNLGDILQEENNLDSALLFYNIAMQNIVAGFSPQADKENPLVQSNKIADKDGLFITLSSKAKVLRQYYETTKNEDYLLAAFDTYLSIDSLVDLMRFEFRSDASKESLVARTKPVYEEAIDLCLALKKITANPQYWTDAFKFAEKSKSIILLEAVRKAKAKLHFDENLIAKEKGLNLKKTFYEREYALAFLGQENHPPTEKILDSLSKYRTEYNALVAEISRINPIYKSLKNETKIVDWTYLQDSLLNANQTFIEYFVGAKAIYAFVIGKTYFETIKLPLDTSLNEIVEQFQEGIRDQTTTKYSELAFELYSKLFASIKKKCPLSEYLVIAPDGILSYIPFDALLRDTVPKEEAGHFKSYPYLLNDHIVSYNYSATLWKEMCQSNEKAGSEKSFGGFAPSFPKGVRVNNKGAQQVTRSLGELRWNIAEVKEINKMLSGDSHLGKFATVDNFLKNAPRYQIIHLSTHGQANDQFGDYSFLVFAGQDKGEYEKLYVKDLYPLQLNADMVVLSACETGIGKLQDGEGMISLARGFSYAGASSIITTLWLVDDVASKDLMIEFYSLLIPQKDKATALNEAKKKYLENQELHRKAHPLYWASFIPVGDMQAIRLNDTAF